MQSRNSLNKYKMHPYKSFWCFLLLIISNQIFSQTENENLVSSDEFLQEVVVTGQIEPQSIKKSVFNVRVITAQDIKNLGANNLGDVLNQYINITVRPSSSTGRSTVSLFGLDASYFKILIDNVPLVNEGGFGNNTDLSQINLNDIEQIEIIEGSMGVTHGANSVSGILNIITKKSSENKWNISATAQEETVGDEFDFFDEGRHIQNLKISHNFSENWFVSLGGNHNDFKGFMGDRNGKYYSINDGSRGYKWLPKEQYQTNGIINYKKNDFRTFYKFEYLDEVIDFYGSAAQSGFNSQLGAYKYGDDQRYFTNRFYHHLNIYGKVFSELNYNVSASYQSQKREVETFRYNITHDVETNNLKVKDQSMDVLYSTGTLSNFFKDKKFDLQLGYEVVNNKGFSIVDEEGNTTREVNENINNYDFFAVSEIKWNDKFSVRPGARYSFQNMFDNQYAISLGTRYLMPHNLEFRLGIGKSFKTPSFEELFNKLIFDGHYFVGNEYLTPEQSMSYEANLKKQTYFESGASLHNNLMLSYIDIDDRITSALVGFQDATPIYQYINISKYRSINAASTNQFKFGDWNFALGASLTGISQKINNLEFSSEDKFLYNFNLNSSASYTYPKWNTTFAVYYKYTGKTQQFVEGSGKYVLSDIEPYSWLDASIRQTFLKESLEVTLGARNLLNITDINQTRMNEGAGHAVSNQILLAYGTSYFLKLTYNLGF